MWRRPRRQVAKRPDARTAAEQGGDRPRAITNGRDERGEQVEHRVLARRHLAVAGARHLGRLGHGLGGRQRAARRSRRAAGAAPRRHTRPTSTATTAAAAVAASTAQHRASGGPRAAPRPRRRAASPPALQQILVAAPRAPRAPGTPMTTARAGTSLHHHGAGGHERLLADLHARHEHRARRRPGTHAAASRRAARGRGRGGPSCRRWSA